MMLRHPTRSQVPPGTYAVQAWHEVTGNDGKTERRPSSLRTPPQSLVLTRGPRTVVLGLPLLFLPRRETSLNNNHY